MALDNAECIAGLATGVQYAAVEDVATGGVEVGGASVFPVAVAGWVGAS